MGLSKDEVELVKTIFIVGCITVLEIFNIIYFRVDGAILSLVVGGLLGLLGYKVGKTRIPSETEIAEAVSSVASEENTINKPET
jgi:hypothetical protein